MKNNAPVEFLTKRILHIDPNERYKRQPSDLDVRARQATSDVFFEDEPTVGEWLRQFVPTRHGAADYLHSLFPSATWIGRYNLHWLLGDAIAGKLIKQGAKYSVTNSFEGLTVGLVVVPQAMAYASLAQLSPEYGLYTSFTGAVLYWLFGTSKDIVIGASTCLYALRRSIFGTNISSRQRLLDLSSSDR